jgi:hypothetical protein
MAQMRSADRVRKGLLFGVDRTYRRHHETDAFDPKQTWRSAIGDVPKRKTSPHSQW